MLVRFRLVAERVLGKAKLSQNERSKVVGRPIDVLKPTTRIAPPTSRLECVNIADAG